MPSQVDGERRGQRAPVGKVLELLTPTLLSEQREAVDRVRRLGSRLGLELGWHYIVDLVWVLKHLNARVGSVILDAGAGNGLMQFALAERGYDVWSVDFAPRRIPLLAALAFRVGHTASANFDDPYINHLRTRAGTGPLNVGSRILDKLRMIGPEVPGLVRLLMGRLLGLRKVGALHYYRADMRDMAAIPTAAVDAVISVSAIEHMERDSVPDAVREFCRVVRPGGRLLITTSAARTEDWFHRPSRGWCYSERSVRELFHVGPDVSSNWSSFDDVLEKFRGSSQLRRWLSHSYRRSGNNGMPWGTWDPRYLPVGIIADVM